MTILIRNAVTVHLGSSLVALAVAVAVAARVAVTARHHPPSRAVHGHRPTTSTRVSPRWMTALGRPRRLRSPALVSSLVGISWPQSRQMALRVEDVQFDAGAVEIIRRGIRDGQIRLIASTSPPGDPAGYRDGELRQRDLNPALAACPLPLLEVDTAAPIGPTRPLCVRGIDTDGYQVLRVSAATGADSLASVALRIRDTGARPHLYFTVPDGNRLTYLVRYTRLAKTANRIRDLIRRADMDVTRRPVVHLDG